jgi:hypothetical protein
MRRSPVVVAIVALHGCGGHVESAVRDAGPDAAPALAIDAGPPFRLTTTAPDCPGCGFPPAGATRCTDAPTIKIVYPPDGVLLPPNLGILSVQWVPYGAPFQRFEVDVTQSAQAPSTDLQLITACAAETTDSRGAPTGGCEVSIDATTWTALASANRGGPPLGITVRGTTDGACASSSADTVHVALAEQDITATYYAWQSDSTPLGTGGQVWRKTFGNPSTSPVNVTGEAFGGALCAGCHALSRDGSRMAVYAIDDTDTDYGGLAGSYLDTTALPGGVPTVLTGPPGGATGDAGGAGQPPGWAAVAPNAAWYVTSNGAPCVGVGAPCEGTGGYPAAVPASSMPLWNGQTGAFVGALALGAAGARPAMPDWSADGQSLVYVVPTADGTWDNGRQTDDDHVFGGSLYTVSFSSGALAAAPAALVRSSGENNYYPSFSPDSASSFVLFDRAALDPTVAPSTACNGIPPQATCPNDSFANPAARLTVLARAQGSPAVDLEAANGSSSSVNLPWSNSYPRWVPAVGSHKGQVLYWISFSSTRDYGLRVTNQRAGYYPCYPPDSLEWPGSTHHAVLGAQCQQPQLWMAPVLVDAGAHTVTADPSGVAFYVPYQDATTHNHMAAWTE